MSNEKYDLIVIGGGPGGYRTAVKASKNGLKVLMFEKENFGGVCLNRGCIPSKALLHSVRRYSFAKNSASYGVIDADNVSFDLAAAVKRKDRVVNTLLKGMEFSIKKTDVTVVREEAKITGKKDVLFSVEAGGKEYYSEKLVIASGSKPSMPPVEGIDSSSVITSREALSLEQVPEKMVVIGGGVIGLEMASFFAEAGSSVSVVEMMPDIAPGTEKETASVLKREMKKTGVKFYLGTTVKKIQEDGVVIEKDGENETLEADKVLVSTGRTPGTAGTGIEKLNIELEGRAVKTDNRGRTSLDNVWAVGDITGRMMLAHAATTQAEVCVDDILGKEASVNYQAIPSVIYTHPEISSVGFTEKEAVDKGYDIAKHSIPMLYDGRYVAEVDAGRGLCKVIADKNTRKILGIHIASSYSSEMIHSGAMMIAKGMTADDLKGVCFPHPTESEIIEDGVSGLF